MTRQPVMHDDATLDSYFANGNPVVCLWARTVTLTPSDIETVLPNGYELVPAIDGKALMPIQMIGSIVSGSTPYAADFVLDMANVGELAALERLLQNAGPVPRLSVFAVANGVAINGVGWPADFIGANIQISTNNAPHGGDYSLTITTVYLVI